MKPALFVICLYFFSSANCQKEFNWFNEYNRDFDAREIGDSGYTVVNVYTFYSDHIGDENWRDTLFTARFDAKGRIIFQNIKNPVYDSTINIFFYSDSNYLKRKIIKVYSLTSRGRVSLDTIDYDKYGKVLKQSSTWGTRKTTYTTLLTNLYNNKQQLTKRVRTGRENSVTRYFYNKTDHLEKTIKKPDNSTIVFLNEFDKKDSLIKCKVVESYGDKTDSVVYTYSYNDQGNLIRKTKYPSPTYFKTFDLSCSEGERYDDLYDYDSLGRQIYEASELDKGRIAFTSVAHTKTRYYDFGFIKETFDTNGKISFKTVYNYYTGYQWGKRYLRESYNLTSRTTTFMSEKSKLIFYIDISENQSDGNQKYIYEYRK